MALNSKIKSYTQNNEPKFGILQPQCAVIAISTRILTFTSLCAKLSVYNNAVTHVKSPHSPLKGFNRSQINLQWLNSATSNGQKNLLLMQPKQTQPPHHQKPLKAGATSFMKSQHIKRREKICIPCFVFHYSIHSYPTFLEQINVHIDTHAERFLNEL